MNAITASKAMKQVQSVAEKIRNDETAEVGTMSIGDVVRQGDIYFVAIERLPLNRTLIKSRQLAPGTSQGSRHILLGDCPIYNGGKEEVSALIAIAAKGVSTFAELIGPVFETPIAVEADHPEHGNRILPPGCYAVVYQRAYAEEVRRQQD